MTMNPKLQRRIIRAAKIIDRAERWLKLSFMTEQEAQQILLENEEAEAADFAAEAEASDRPKKKSYLRKKADTCSVCGAGETASATPNTTYACGGHDYDQRPGTVACPTLDGAEDDDVEAETIRTDEIGGVQTLTGDDAAGPPGPRANKNKSRYQIQPGHGQGLSDLLRTTAALSSSKKITKLLSGR